MLLWLLWTHQLHGHSRDGHLFLSSVNLFVLLIRLMFFIMLSAHVHQLMWLTTSSYLSPIRFHCVSLMLCAVGKHSTFESIIERPCRGGSLSSGEWQQCPGTEQCRLTKGSKCEVSCNHLVIFAVVFVSVIRF